MKSLLKATDELVFSSLEWIYILLFQDSHKKKSLSPQELRLGQQYNVFLSITLMVQVCFQ